MRLFTQFIGFKLISLAICIIIVCSIVNLSCKGDLSNLPVFEGSGAHSTVKKQVDFGPRVPGTDAHKKCKDWLVAEFKKNGADVIEQEFIAKTFDGKELQAYNIIASINPKSRHRIIIAAHWDSRPFSDEESDSLQARLPVLGADDGASGVAVIMELSRILNQKKLKKYGIDFILFDAEDYGEPGGEMETWCLGSQYWSKNPHEHNYRADYGILLDMVGADKPRFDKEEFSVYFAPKVVEKVWKVAHGLGFKDNFVNINGQGLVDDHVFVNRDARIPMIDIINRPLGSKTHFVPHWHTQNDNLNAISPKSLEIVGKVLTQLIYLEDADKI